jgi:hypothetical protein
MYWRNLVTWIRRISATYDNRIFCREKMLWPRPNIQDIRLRKSLLKPQFQKEIRIELFS